MASRESALRRIKLHHLRVVMAVAAAGSMAGAARQLSISQPVVSKMVGEIEALLGARLFDRAPHGVAPTRYGEALLRRARAIFDEIEGGFDEVRFLTDPTAGELRIGGTEPLLSGIVATAILHLRKTHPGVSWRLVQSDTATLLSRELPERRIDLAVVPIGDTVDDETLDVRPIYDDFWHVVASRRSPWVKRRRLALRDLADAAWCATPLDTRIGSQLVTVFREAGLTAPRLAVAGVLSPALVAQFLEDERLVAVMSDSLLNYFGRGNGDLARLNVKLQMRPFRIALVKLRHRTVSPIAELFIQRASEIGEEIAARRKK